MSTSNTEDSAPCTAFFEEVTERFGGRVIASTVRPATDREIAEARHMHEEGECPHNIVIDERDWFYDYRKCVTCGQILGAI